MAAVYHARRGAAYNDVGRDAVPEAVWPRMAVMGAGAVGCYFGGMLARAGAPVTLIGRPRHVEAVTRDGLLIERADWQARIAVRATTQAAAARDAAIVLFCVKTLDTEQAARLLAPRLSPGAQVVSLQNGVDNVDRMREAAGIEAIPAVVYVACRISAPGSVTHSGRGDLIIGDVFERGRSAEDRQRDLDGIAAVFARAGVPCRVSGNIQGELWTKMIINCAYNAISALGRARYGRLARHPDTREVMRQVVEEAVAIAGAAGVRLPQINMVETVWKLADAMEGAVSSTAQDLARGNRTEIDSLNGYLVRRAAALGVPAPENQTLHALVKLLEESLTAPSGCSG